MGFLLWGAGGALRSGALEALVFTELDRLGATDRYARLIGRTRTAEVLGAAGSGAVAGPVFAAGGYPAVGLASVLTCLLAAAVATRLPEHRPARPSVLAAGVPAATAPGDRPADGDEPGWLASLRGGLAEARADQKVRAALLLVAVVTAIWGGLDEYTALLARDTGVAEATVPLLLLLMWAGMTAGGLLAPLAEGLTNRGYAGLLALAASTLAAGALVRRPAGFLLLAVAFAAFQVATVLADVRLGGSDHRDGAGNGHLGGRNGDRSDHRRVLRRVRRRRRRGQQLGRLRGGRPAVPGAGARPCRPSPGTWMTGVDGTRPGGLSGDAGRQTGKSVVTG